MRTQFCIILLAIGLVLTSCQPDFSNERDHSQQLRIWYLHGAAGIDEFISVASVELIESNLNVSWKPCTALELKSLTGSIHDTLRPDIVIVPSGYAEMMARMGISRDIEPSLDRDIPQSTELCRSKGGLVGYPLYCDMLQVLINKNVMRVIAEDVECITWPPEDDCIAPQVLLSTIANGLQKPVTPWGTVFDNAHTMADFVASWMSWFGASIVDSLQQPSLVSQQSINALTTFAELSREGVIDTERQLQAMFLRGQLGMYVGHASIVRHINPGLNIAMSMMPVCGMGANQGALDQLTVTMATVTKHCRDTAAAHKALKALKTLTKERFRSGFPTTVSFWESARRGNDAELRILARRVQRGTPSPAVRSWSQMADIISQAYFRVVMGQSEIQESLERAQVELREVLAQ